jgi:hypothetical protein
LPDVSGADREGHGMRADDVQAVQARLLLVLSTFAGCKLKTDQFIFINR